jgi:hypothetical protein
MSFKLALVAASLLFLSSVAEASITGSISGTIKDATGGVVPGAHVSVIELSTQARQDVKSGAIGEYSFLALAVGH